VTSASTIVIAQSRKKFTMSSSSAMRSAHLTAVDVDRDRGERGNVSGRGRSAGRRGDARATRRGERRGRRPRQPSGAAP
jgi:hypothetical protein